MASHRTVVGLSFARECPRPDCIPHSRPRKASKKAGIAYEVQAALALPHAKAGRWWHFLDKGGQGYCQTDLTLDAGMDIIVLECKLTWLPSAHTQIDALYRPVVEKATGRKVHGIVVVKNLAPGCPPSLICTSMGEAMRRTLDGVDPVLHWPNPLGPASAHIPAEPGSRLRPGLALTRKLA